MTGWAHRRFPRLLVALAAGIAAAFAVSLLTPGHWLHALTAGWAAGAFLFVARTWWLLWPMDAEQTRAHARREDPGRGPTDVALLAACVASVVAVGALLLASDTTGVAAWVTAGVGVVGVAASWCLVPTVYAVRYADVHYGGRGDRPAVDFGDGEAPTYADFAYLAFTLQMAYQVSDTALRAAAARRLGLSHALLSYFLGVVVIGCTVNLMVSLAAHG